MAAKSDTELEHFEKAGKGTTLTNYRQITKTGATGWDNSSYGSTIIETAKNENIYIWTFHIAKCAYDSGMVIGITSKYSITTNAFSREKVSPNYGVLSYNGQKVSKHNYKSYGKQFKENDIINMILNLKKRTISYKINDIDQGVAYNNIVVGNDVNYKLAVTLGATNNSLQIIDFTIKHSSSSNSKLLELISPQNNVWIHISCYCFCIEIIYIIYT